MGDVHKPSFSGRMVVFPTLEQSGHQYGNQLMYVCLSPVGGTMVLFMTPGRVRCQHRPKPLEKTRQEPIKRRKHILQGPKAAY